MSLHYVGGAAVAGSLVRRDSAPDSSARWDIFGWRGTAGTPRERSPADEIEASRVITGSPEARQAPSVSGA